MIDTSFIDCHFLCLQARMPYSDAWYEAELRAVEKKNSAVLITETKEEQRMREAMAELKKLKQHRSKPKKENSGKGYYDQLRRERMLQRQARRQALMSRKHCRANNSN